MCFQLTFVSAPTAVSERHRHRDKTRGAVLVDVKDFLVGNRHKSADSGAPPRPKIRSERQRHRERIQVRCV
jgi:hypothetical protein